MESYYQSPQTTYVRSPSKSPPPERVVVKEVTVPLVEYREVEVPVEKIVIKEIPVEVPVERIVEKIVTKEVPVEVEKIVTVERIVEKPVIEYRDRVVEKPVIEYRDRVVETERVVEVPVYQPVATTRVSAPPSPQVAPQVVYREPQVTVDRGLLLFIGTRLVTHALSCVHSAFASCE